MNELTPAEAAEVAQFTDTGKTVLHRGRTFAILLAPDDAKRKLAPYILRSARGRYYAMSRNVPRPEHLFGIALYGGRLKCLDGWFTDKSGELVSLG